MVKLIVFDCDGTLLTDNNEILPSTRRALQKLNENGIKIGFASGRTQTGIRKVIEKIGITEFVNYLICFNGGEIANFSDESVLYENFFTEDDIKQICKWSTGFGVHMVSQTEIYTTPNNKYAKIEAEKNDLKLLSIDFVKNNIYKIIFSGETDLLQEHAKEISLLADGKYNVVLSDMNSLEFMPITSSKRNALKLLCESQDIELEETVAFGDGENDAEMLEVATIGVAMGNAMEKTKAVADFVTDTNNNDGIEKALEKLGLI